MPQNPQVNAPLVTTASPLEIARHGDSGVPYEADTIETFARAMKIGRTMVYADIGRGLIKVVKRGKKTLIPPGERQAYMERLAAASAPAPEAA